MLSKHLNELKVLKLSLYDPREEDGKLLTVDLHPSGERRASRQSNPFARAAAGAAQQSDDPDAEISAVFAELAQLIDTMAEWLFSYLKPPNQNDLLNFALPR